MKEARELLQDLWSQGVELRVENGGLLARPSSRVSPAHRKRLTTHKPEVIALLKGEASFISPDQLANIRRLANHIGTIVEFDGRKGLLIGLFRDRAIVDTGKVILSLHHHDVRTA